ncbi:MAG: AbrB/MazE/SpoVT family DNA-binding domain-containing protein [Nitrososphaerales archaeon]
MDDKGRLHIPKEIRDRLGLRSGQVLKWRIEGESLVVEPALSVFDRLANSAKCNFGNLEKVLPKLRRAAEKQGRREVN